MLTVMKFFTPYVKQTNYGVGLNVSKPRCSTSISYCVHMILWLPIFFGFSIPRRTVRRENKNPFNLNPNSIICFGRATRLQRMCLYKFRRDLIITVENERFAPKAEIT